MGKTSSPNNGTRRHGPAPTLDPGTEQRTILDAALRVLRRRGVSGMTLDEVLSEAALSTRSFYRQYSSKDELLIALHRREAMAVGVRMRKVIAGATTATDALASCVDDLLAITYDSRRAARASLLRSSLTMDSSLWDGVHRLDVDLMTAPLAELLERGRRDGTFPGAEPETDARTILTLTLAIMADISGRADRPRRAETRALVLRYVLPPLGLVGVPQLRG